VHLNFEDIQSIEVECESHYNDEGGYYSSLDTLAINYTNGRCFCIWDYYDELFSDIDDFNDYLDKHGTIKFVDQTPPFNLEIVE